MVWRSAERLSPAVREEFRGDGLESGEVERLFQKRSVAAQRLDPGGELLVTKGCHHNDRRADAGGSRRVDRAQPRHPWHRDIGDDEIEGAVLCQTVDQLGAVAGPDDIGSEMREAVGYDVEQFRVVIRDEDASVERHCHGSSNQHAEWHPLQDRCWRVSPSVTAKVPVVKLWSCTCSNEVLITLADQPGQEGR